MAGKSSKKRKPGTVVTMWRKNFETEQRSVGAHHWSPYRKEDFTQISQKKNDLADKTKGING